MLWFSWFGSSGSDFEVFGLHLQPQHVFPKCPCCKIVYRLQIQTYLIKISLWTWCVLDDRSHWKVLSIQEIILKVRNKEKSSCSEVWLIKFFRSLYMWRKCFTMAALRWLYDSVEGTFMTPQCLLATVKHFFFYTFQNLRNLQTMFVHFSNLFFC